KDEGASGRVDPLAPVFVGERGADRLATNDRYRFEFHKLKHGSAWFVGTFHTEATEPRASASGGPHPLADARGSVASVSLRFKLLLALLELVLPVGEDDPAQAPQQRRLAVAVHRDLELHLDLRPLLLDLGADDGRAGAAQRVGQAGGLGVLLALH